MHIERSIVVNAEASEVFAQVNDFHNWQAWSPWEKLDPAMKREFSGAQEGVGSIYSWEGNDQVGKGSMEITESIASEKIMMDLRFLEPMEVTNVSTVTLAPEGEGTKVTWSMDGEQTYLMKVICIFVNMDGLIGKDFETGLQNLKAIVEA
jgi:hypothetical protein